jgi:hypothetical protein
MLRPFEADRFFLLISIAPGIDLPILIGGRIFRRIWLVHTGFILNLVVLTRRVDRLFRGQIGTTPILRFEMHENTGELFGARVGLR